MKTKKYRKLTKNHSLMKALTIWFEQGQKNTFNDLFLRQKFTSTQQIPIR